MQHPMRQPSHHPTEQRVLDVASDGPGVSLDVSRVDPSLPGHGSAEQEAPSESWTPVAGRACSVVRP